MGFGQTTTKGRRFPAEILTNDEVKRLLDGMSERGSCGIRDRALVAMLYRGGLRINEALSLYPKDVDVRAGTVHVLQAKGGKSRLIGLDGQAVKLLVRWIVRRRVMLGLNGQSPIFCSLKGKPLARANVSTMMKRLAREAGIEKRVHPHGLRHARAVDLVNRGVDVVTISQAWGHSNISTTNTYLNHLAPAKVIAAMRDGEW